MKRFDLFDIKKDEYELTNVTSTEISEFLNITNIHVYVALNKQTAIKRRYLVNLSAPEEVLNDWDNTRLKINPKARI